MRPLLGAILRKFCTWRVKRTNAAGERWTSWAEYFDGWTK